MCEVNTNIKTYVRFYYMNVIMDTTMSVVTLISHTCHLMVRVCMMFDVMGFVSTAAGYA